MKSAGFDLDNNAINDEQRVHWAPDDIPEVYDVTPMIHFCRTGDLKMCRYLFVNGASCTRVDDDGFWFPMYAAAMGLLFACLQVAS